MSKRLSFVPRTPSALASHLFMFSYPVAEDMAAKGSRIQPWYLDHVGSAGISAFAALAAANTLAFGIRALRPNMRGKTLERISVAAGLLGGLAVTALTETSAGLSLVPSEALDVPMTDITVPASVEFVEDPLDAAYGVAGTVAGATFTRVHDRKVDNPLDSIWSSDRKLADAPRL
jgi:hypothetical protein